MFYQLLKQNIKNSYQNISKPIANILFFLLINFSLLLFLQEISQNQSNYSIIRVIMWFSLLFSIFYQSVNFLKEDYQDGTIEQMIIICQNLESYVLAKIISFWIEFCLPIVIIAMIVMNIFAFPGEEIIQNAILLAISSIAISFISCLCASFNIISKRATLLAILAMPIILPVIMMAIVGNVQILIALTIFLSIISLFCCTKVVRIVSE